MINVEDYNILNFYGYTTFIQNVISEYSEHDGRGHIQTKWFVKKLIEEGSKKAGLDLSDNKIAFKILHIETGTILYAGFKDGVYRIGLTCRQQFGRNYDFVKGEWNLNNEF